MRGNVTMGSKKDIIVKMQKFSSASEIKTAKLQLNMDVYLLNSIIAFIFKDSVLRTRKTLSNILKLFNSIDNTFYENKVEQQARIWIIRKTLELILNDKMQDPSNIKAQLIEDMECEGLKRDLIDRIDDYKIGYEESRKLVLKLDDRLRFGYIITVKQLAEEVFRYIDEDDYKTYREVSEILYRLASTVISIKRNTNSLDSDQTFSLDAERFENCITDAVYKLQDKMKILKTGIKRLNTFLGGGYFSKRLYLYLAFPGGGKSQMLLKSAIDIKRYNRVTPKNPENNPAVLYITMENSIEETIERIFNMVVCPDDIRNFTPKQVIKKLRDGGKLTLTDEDNINIIIKYYPNKSIDTNDLYGIISDLEDEGNEVICLILDYIKRIRSVEKYVNDKTELKNVSNELKNLANYFDISVITAQQLNRTSASIVDSALQAKKEDLAKLIGRDGVGDAWELVENGDWLCILNQEIKASTNQLHMTFKLLKRRYYSSEDSDELRRLNYFNHPYEPGNDIRLIDDINLEKSVSVALLGTDLVAAEQQKRGQRNATKRDDDDISFEGELEFEPFDTKKNIYY